MSTPKRTKMKKKLFLTLTLGQYIMDNYLPSRCEEIGKNPEKQWEKWKNINGRIVTIYDSRKDCLRDWWAKSSVEALRSKSRAVYLGSMSKKVFMETPNGYYLMFTQGTFDCVKLGENREEQWSQYKEWNGLFIMIFKNHVDYALEKNELFGQLIG